MLRGIGLKSPWRDVNDHSPADTADCGHEVWPGEFMAEWDGKMLCPDCWKSQVMYTLEKYPKQLALDMQLRLETFD